MYQYLASDYYATGEGRTICLLITGAYPRQDDYELDSSLKNSEKFRAAREFIEQFDPWYAQGAENLSKEDFMKRFGQYVPEPIKKMLDEHVNLHFSQRFYFNYG